MIFLDVVADANYTSETKVAQCYEEEHQYSKKKKPCPAAACTNENATAKHHFLTQSRRVLVSHYDFTHHKFLRRCLLLRNRSFEHRFTKTGLRSLDMMFRRSSSWARKLKSSARNCRNQPLFLNSHYSAYFLVLSRTSKRRMHIFT